MVYVIINLDNINLLYSNEKKIVLFTMRGCPYCVNLKAEWNIIKQKYKSNKKIPIFEVERSLLQFVKNDITKKISGFPTIAILKGTKLIKTFSENISKSSENLDEFILSIKPKKLKF